MSKSQVANLMLRDVPWDGNELASPLTLPGALIAPSYVEQQMQTTPANPPAGKMRLYPKPDGKYYTLSPGGTETELGAGGGGAYVHPDPFTIGTITVSTKATLKSPDITGDMSFVADNTYDLGPGSKRPRDLFVARNAAVGGDVTATNLIANTVKTTTGTLVIQTGDASPINFKPNGVETWSVAADGHFRPTSTNGTLDLGATATRVRNLYLYNVIDQRQINTPAPPAAGSLRIYAKTNGKLFTINSAGVETDLTALGHVVADPLTLNEGLTVNGYIQTETLDVRPDIFTTGSTIRVHETSDTLDSAYGLLAIDATQVKVGAGAVGVGVAKPLSILVGNEKVRVETTGWVNVLSGGVSVAEHVEMANRKEFRWVDASSKIMSYDRTMYFDDSAGWAWRVSPSFAAVMFLNSSGGLKYDSYSEQKQIATPGNPPAGYLRMYAKGDGKYYYLSPAGVEKPMGAEDPLSLNKLIMIGTAPRIVGDFSNATLANRVMIQDSGVDKGTSFGVIPSGAATSGNITIFNSSDPANSAFLQMVVSSTVLILNAGKVGTGADLPLAFNVNGAERLRIAIDGVVSTPGKLAAGIAPSWGQPGDLFTARAGGTSGTIYFGNADGKYLHYDGTSYTIAGGALYTGAISATGAITASGRVRGGDVRSDGWVYAAGNHYMWGDPYSAWMRWNAGDASLETSHYLKAPSLYISGQISTAAKILTTAPSGGYTIANAPGGGGNYGMEVQQPGGGACMIAFHRPGYWAAHFGVDTDNLWKVGGWSMGAASYPIHHDGNYPVSESASGSTLVKRTVNGYIYCNYINTSADDQGGASPYRVAGQNGDGFLRWYTKSAVGRPPAWGTQENYFSIGGASTPGGGWTNVGAVSPTSNPLGCTYSGNSVWVQRTGYWVIRYRASVNGGGWAWTGGLRILLNGGGWVERTGTMYNGVNMDVCEVCVVGAGTYFTFQGISHGSGAYGTGSISAGTVHFWFVPTDQYPL